MALNRGLGGKSPCPVCLVPDCELHSFLKKWPRRDMNEIIAIVERAGSMLRKDKAAAKQLLKAQGLRGIENAFWEVRFSSPYEALGFDHMHNYPHGLGGRHLWPQLQLYITKLGGEAARKIDEQAADFPRWRGLNHFNAITDQSFADAVKHQDVVRIIPFVAHNVITQAKSKNGFLLLQCIRSYLIVDAYLTMDVHSEDMINEGRMEFVIFGNLMQRYITSTADLLTKSWDIPKMHLHSHAFDDIMDKGSLSVYDSMFNEPLHGPLKDSYLLRTNFKNIESQILKADHCAYVASYLRTMITDADDRAKEKLEATEFLTPKPDSKHLFGNIIIGSRSKQQSVEELLSGNTTNMKYYQFKEKLSSFLAQQLPSMNTLLTTIYDATKIDVFKYVKASYECLVSWREKTDHLRCNPSFSDGKPRYDSVLLETENGPVFAELVLVFTLKILHVLYPIALVQTYSRCTPAPNLLKKDQALRFLRVQKTAEKRTEFVWARSILRGAVLIPAKDSPKNDAYIVYDVLDSDMMLRVKYLLQIRHQV